MPGLALIGLAAYALLVGGVRNFGSLAVLQAALGSTPPPTCQPQPRLQAAQAMLTWPPGAPVGPEGYLLAAEADTRQGCAEAAFDGLAQGHGQWPADALLAWRLGEAYAARGDNAAAIAAWRNAPIIALRFSRQGRAAVLTRNWETALTAYTTAIEVDPTLGEAYYGLGQTLAHGYARLRDALAAYERARELDAPEPYLPVEVAHALARLGRFAEARAELDAAGAGNALSNALRGQAYLAEGRADEAVHYYERAVRQAPRQLDFRYQLGLAYARQGRLDEARAAWRAVLELAPRHTRAAQALDCVTETELPERCYPAWARLPG
jgi:tetratricopeptide (TPR) repeat protein